MFRRVLLASALLSLLASPVFAKTTPQPAPLADSGAIHEKDLISFGLGYTDFDKTEALRQSADMRLEYRWGLSLLPLLSNWFKSWDNYVQFHPMVGIEAGNLGQAYGVGGWAMDWYICHHVVFTWNEAVGLYYPGNAVRLGSPIEFRSQAELGWRFDNAMRISAQISHISNAKITDWNPGSEMVGVYLHVPSDMIFGK